MLVNLIILLVVFAFAVLFGWLCYRSIRAKKLWKKLVGGVGFALLTLIFLALAFMGGKGIATAYFPGAPAAPDLTVAGTPEQIARGDYLVNMSCIGCHSDVGADGAPSMQHPLNGGWNIAAAEGFGFVGDLVAENLTPGGKLAGYTDGELFRTLRHRVDEDGDLLVFMSLLPYAQLSDADTEAIVAYLRTLPAAEQSAATGDKLSFVGALMFGAGMFGTPEKGTDSVTAPPQGVTAEYGKYVATFAECRGCHGPDVTGTPASAMGAAVPNPRPLVGDLSQEQFAEMMRTGVKPDGVAFPPTMPWQVAAQLTDDDLAALYAYLTAPVQ
ncbi:MAG: c-type cytochrome [Caldilineales bacterium]|nr:c-type cytochrome [Caldilineales bacterium]